MPYTLVGPTVTGLVQDTLAVTRLENQLYMCEGGCKTDFINLFYVVNFLNVSFLLFTYLIQFLG